MTAPAETRQQQRSRSTQRRLLEAAVECLVERGWAGTTTTLVADRAGVSRGAQLHHYRTKSALLIAAVEHLAERRSAELRAEAAELPPDGDRVEATIRLLASLFTGPLFSAAIEVWVAARTDPALRTALVPVEARFGREVHRLTVELLGADESRPGYARPCRPRSTSCAGSGWRACSPTTRPGAPACSPTGPPTWTEVLR